jgi:hypothetical protein
MTSDRSGLVARVFPAALAAIVVGFGLYFDHAASSDGAPQERVASIDSELAHEAASVEVRHIAQWAVATHDHGGLPFVVVDPGEARIYAFDPQGHPRGNGPMRVQADETLAVAGRLVADPITSARSGAIVWANADAQLAVGTGDEDAAEPLTPALRVDPAFWRDCLSALRTQPSIAYVLPRTAASIRDDADRRPS